MFRVRSRHWDPNSNAKFLGLGLGLIFADFEIGIGIDFSKVWDWDWAWDYKFRTKSQEIPRIPRNPKGRYRSLDNFISMNYQLFFSY